MRVKIKQTEAAWHNEAHQLRAQGVPNVDIALRFGVKSNTVQQMFSRDDTAVLAYNERTDAWFVEKHVPRTIRKVLKPRNDVMAAARLFAAGAIDRAAFMQAVAA